VCRQTPLFEFCLEFTARIALREMPEEFSEKFQKTPVEMGKHEIERHVFQVCV
jgi:hypothetical protein